MTSLHRTAIRAFSSRCGRFAGRGKVCVPVLFGLLCMSGRATTEMEDKINKAPMPHEARGTSGDLVKVHWVSSRGYLAGTMGNAAQLARLRADVDDCIRHAANSPVKPVRAWPDFVNSNRTDMYSSVNRSISYHSGVIYALNPLDCSLLELQTATAELSSTQGQCNIDLIKKTAHGNCNAKAHSDALPPRRVAASPLAEVDAAAQKTPGNPALAALAAAMRQHSPASAGLHKTIAGLECAVWKNPFFPDGTGCLSLGGSFVASQAASGLTQSSMELEMTSSIGPQSRAVAAKLDTTVAGAVFAPYLAGGFTITSPKARK